MTQPSFKFPPFFPSTMTTLCSETDGNESLDNVTEVIEEVEVG